MKRQNFFRIVLMVFCLFFIGTNNIFATDDLPNCEYSSLQACYNDRINSNDPSAQQTEQKKYCERTCNLDGVIVDTSMNSTNKKTLYQGTYLKCGNSGSFPSMLPKLSRILVMLLQVITPIILIVLGMIDFMKAVASDNADGLDKAKKKFISRIIAACTVFLVFTIVKFAVSAFATEDNGYMQCASCFINDSGKCQNANYDPLTEMDSSEEQ